MIKISLNSLANFMTSGATKQRKILTDYKYPDPEGIVMAKYYKEAKPFIRAFHKNEHSRNWLKTRARNLESLAEDEAGNTATRLTNNARAIKMYEEFFGDKSFEILENLNLSIEFGDVKVNVNPDMHVLENTRNKIIKLDFTKDPKGDDFIRIMCQLMFEATQQHNLNLPSSCVLYYDVSRGEEYRGARLGSRMRNDIIASCQMIEAIWPTL